MSRFVPIGLVSLGAAVLITACTPFARTVIRGSGEVATQEFALDGFDRVEAGRTFDLHIRPADTFAVTLRADDAFLDYITVERRGDELRIDVDDDVDLRGTHSVEITMPSLQRLELHGAAAADVAGFDGGARLELDLSGASDLECGDLEAGTIALELSGASDASCAGLQTGHLDTRLSGASELRLEGSATAGKIKASGASEAVLDELELVEADVRLSGASHAQINVRGRLEADLSGASRLRYAGAPELGTMKTSGGSSVDPA